MKFSAAPSGIDVVRNNLKFIKLSSIKNGSTASTITTRSNKTQLYKRIVPLLLILEIVGDRF